MTPKEKLQKAIDVEIRLWSSPAEKGRLADVVRSTVIAMVRGVLGRPCGSWDSMVPATPTGLGIQKYAMDLAREFCSPFVLTPKEKESLSSSFRSTFLCEVRRQIGRAAEEEAARVVEDLVAGVVREL